MIVYIIIILVVLGLLGMLVEFIKDHSRGFIIAAVIIAAFVVSYLVKGWRGVLGVLGAIVLFFVIKEIGKGVKAHDEKKKEIAEINSKTQADNRAHNNDSQLMEELNKNCCWLGAMDTDKWKQKLSNYASRPYSTSFEEITQNFAKQMEEQHITQNDDWFEPFKQFVLNHPGGVTAAKMLHEVSCPQLKMTHITPDIDLITAWLSKGTKPASKSVPALFNSTNTGINEEVYAPTDYLKHLYKQTVSEEPASVSIELDFDDL